MKIVPGKLTDIALFDEDEQRELRSLLSEFDENKVNRFIFDTQGVCMMMLINFPDNNDPSKYKKPSKTPHTKLFTNMKKQFAETRKYLELIARESAPAWRPRYPSRLSDIFPSDVNNPDWWQTNNKAVGIAQAAIENLNELEKLFHDHIDEPLGKETINAEFAERIAGLYHMHLGKPKGGMNTTFTATLRALFSAVQIEYENVEKLTLKMFPK